MALPALRTARAVFPHTALQSVVSSSGVSRRLPGRVQGEQPGVGEEGVGPALMVGQAAPEAGMLGLLAQDRAQSSSHEPVERREGVWVGVLEVAEPAAQHRVEIGDDPREALPLRPSRLGPDAVLEPGQALPADKPASRLEPVAEEVEAFPRPPASGPVNEILNNLLDGHGP